MLSIILGDGYCAEFDTLTEGAWNTALLSFADATFYHTWAYGAVRCGESRVRRMVLRHDGRLVALAQIRLYGVPLLPLGVAYVHWGPLWRKIGERADLLVLRKAIAALKAEFPQRRGLMLRIVPPVYDSEPQADAIHRTIGELGLKQSPGRGRLLIIDIRSPLEDLRKGIERKWRNQLTSAERSDLVIADGFSEDLLDEYVQLHREMTNRKRLASDGGLSYLVRAFSTMPITVRPCVVIARQQGRPVAGAVLSVLGKTAIYMFGATGHDGMRLKASNLVQWYCVTMLKTLGLESYDLSGINPEANPGTYHFKAGLCGKNGVDARLHEFTCGAGPLNDLLVRTGSMVYSVLRR